MCVLGDPVNEWSSGTDVVCCSYTQTLQGVLGGQKLKMWEICQMAGPISTKFGTHVRIHLGMDIGSKQLAPRDPRGELGGF